MHTPEHYMRETLTLAEKALEAEELPIAATVVLNDKIIAQAHTMEKTEGRLLVHAELLALEKADKLKPFPGKRRDMQLYTNLEPCLMCLGAAMTTFVGEIYYGLESPGDGAVNICRVWERNEGDMPGYQVPVIHGGLLRLESRELFQKYVDIHNSGAMWEWAKTLAALE